MNPVQKAMNILLSNAVDNLQDLTDFYYDIKLKRNTEMFQQDMFINDAKEMADKLKAAYKIGFEAGKKETAKEVNPIKQEWIPALVKYQNTIPIWWINENNRKALYMGKIILVKEIPLQAYASYMSIRENTAGHGNWFWGKEDLILWPTKDDVALANSIKSCCENK